MKVSTLREGTAMASPPPRETEEELVPTGSEPGDPRAKPPIKPKPRTLPTKPALPAKPSLLVPVGPRPPRGPLAELPSARKMNMLAGPQPYGGSKRPLPFAPRPTAEAPDGGEATRETGKEEAGKEEVPPLTPPARCAAVGGVRKAPAPFRPASERFAATTVEEILAKMEQPRKEVSASPDRLWGSRLTFNHDGSSRYGPRTYGMATIPRDEDGGTLSRAWSQEGPLKSPTESEEEHSKCPEERSPPSDLAFNGDLPQPASSGPSADVSKHRVPSSLGPSSENGGCTSLGLTIDISDPVPGSPHLHSPDASPPRPSQLPEAQSPTEPGASPCLPVTPASPSPVLLDEGSCQPPDLGLPAEGALEALRPCSPPLEKVSGHRSLEQPPATSPRPLIEGLLGWAQKDLQSEFGIAADPQPSSFSPSSWSQDASQDYGLGGVSPGGDPGLGESSWTSKYGQGAGEGSTREWASRCGIGQEEMEAGSGDRREASQDWITGKPNPLGTLQSPESAAQDWEFRRRDSQGTYPSRDASLRDWEFGKRDSLGVYSSQVADEQGQELGKKEPLGCYSSQDGGEHDREFEKRDSALGAFGGRDAEQQGQGFGQSTWMSDYSSGSSSTLLGSQDRGFSTRALSAGFSPEEAQQQDEEFEKKIPSGGDSLGEAGRDANQPEEREPGGLFSPSTPQSQDGALGQTEQGSDATQEVKGLQGRQQAGGQSPGDADLEDRETGKRGWATEFSLRVDSQLETTFSPGRPDWSDDFCIEGTERSHQFGIIGNDRASGAGLSPSGKMGGGHFVPPGKSTARPVDWTDQLGLRNLEVSTCLGARGLSEARENAVGQMGWSDNLGLRDMDLASHLETGGSEEPRGIRVGEEDWTSDGGVRSRDFSGVGEVESHSQARESGVGQNDWSGVEAGEFFKSREHGVGQADWTPDFGLRNMASGAGCSPEEPRQLGVGQMDWGNNLGLRNLEVSCDLESGGSPEPRGCGVGQMDWAQDLGLRNVELSGGPSEAREHGVGEVDQCPELDLRNNGGLSPDLEARDPSEARELGVGETSGPETPGEEDSSPSSETHCPEDLGMEMGDVSGFGDSPGRCPARSPPSGSQGLLEEMVAAHSSKAVAHMESAASALGRLSQEGEAIAVADQEEPLEHGRDPLPSWRPQPDGEASRTEEVDGGWDPPGPGQGKQGPVQTPQRPPQCLPPSSLSQDFSFIEDTEILDSAMYRSRANLGRKRGHRAPAIRPGGTLGLSEAADSDARLFQDSTEPRASRVPSSDEEVVEEPQSRRTRMSLGTKGLKVNLFPGLSPSALKAKLRTRNRSAEEGEPAESKSTQKESVVQRSKSCKVPGLGKPLTLPPKPEKSSGSEGSSPNWLQALKLKKKKV
ncbi:182 kDa tankyrase-1-binding protein isoform 3-T4 [Dugong dugon]